jgi:glutathione peroxidase
VASIDGLVSASSARSRFYGEFQACDSHEAHQPQVRVPALRPPLEVGGQPVENLPMKYDISLRTLDGKPKSLSDYRGQTVLIVNVASKCGLTPQYTGLQTLHDRFSPRGFAVLGFPCNQFGGQEPGTPEQISEFCTTNYAVTFPLFEKIAVNGPDRHPLYVELTKVEDQAGKAGDVQWNFEKFLVSPTGEVQRFRPKTEPSDPSLVSAIEAALPSPAG